VYAALAVAGNGGVADWAPEWFLTDVVGRVVIGALVGWLVGRVLGRVAFDPPWRLTALADAGDGFVALAATLLAYATAELVEGYGSLAVFVAAVALRDSERGHSYHRVLHNFAGQVEQVVVTVLLILLGGAAATGVMSALTWQGAAVGLALIIIVRPLSGVAGLIGGRTKPHERHAIAFFGIRGVGSVYYLASPCGSKRSTRPTNCGQSSRSRSWPRSCCTASRRPRSWITSTVVRSAAERGASRHSRRPQPAE
jgi:NhaP-type Na+/H+ or K+/H+ antiporter